MVPAALTHAVAALVQSASDLRTATESTSRTTGDSVSRAVFAPQTYDVPHRFAPPREFSRVHGRRTASLQSRSNRRKKHR